MHLTWFSSPSVCCHRYCHIVVANVAVVIVIIVASTFSSSTTTTPTNNNSIDTRWILQSGYKASLNGNVQRSRLPQVDCRWMVGGKWKKNYYKKKWKEKKIGALLLFARNYIKTVFYLYFKTLHLYNFTDR